MKGRGDPWSNIWPFTPKSFDLWITKMSKAEKLFFRTFLSSKFEIPINKTRLQETGNTIDLYCLFNIIYYHSLKLLVVGPNRKLWKYTKCLFVRSLNYITIVSLVICSCYQVDSPPLRHHNVNYHFILFTKQAIFHLISIHQKYPNIEQKYAFNSLEISFLFWISICSGM